MAVTEQAIESTQDDAEQLPVENPATGEIIAHVPVHGAEDVAAMAARGRAVQPAWNALGFEGRGRVLKRMQKWMTDNAERVIQVVMSETGKAYEDAQLADWSYGVAAFGFWAKNAEPYLADEKVSTASPFVKGKKLVLRYEPLGLIGVIGPWNYPVTNSFGDCIPALAAGNAVILKPSEVTPLTSQVLLEGLLECGMPEGVLQVATGYGETGSALVDEVDMVMFTGSTATGKKIMAKAAETLTPVSLDSAARTRWSCWPTPTSIARRTSRSCTACSTAGRPASRSSASTSRSPSTTSSSRR